MHQRCATRRRTVASRFGIVGAMCVATLTFVATPVRAQGGFFVEASGDYSPVQIATTSQTWGAARLSGGFFEDGRAGWTVAMERQQRDRLVDWGGWARGFRRSGDWTFSGGFGLGADPTFSYRRSFEGELARRVVGTLVAQGGYRYLNFTTTDVHLIQPGATLYLAHGDIGVRYYIVRNASRETTTGTLQVQGTVNLNQRVRVGGGGAFGERIFDVVSLQTPSADSWVGYGYMHITASPAWSFDVGLGRARENPYFSQSMLTLGVRRTFARRP